MGYMPPYQPKGGGITGYMPLYQPKEESITGVYASLPA